MFAADSDDALDLRAHIMIKEHRSIPYFVVLWSGLLADRLCHKFIS